MKLKKCLILGFGSMGERHLRAIKKFNFNQIDIVDKNSSRLSVAHTSYKIPKYNLFTKTSEVKKNYYSLVIIATTADVHLKNFREMSSLSKCILIEKPLATSLKDCEIIKKIAKNKNITVAVNHQKRFSSEYFQVKNIIKKYKLKKFINLNVIGGNAGIAMNGVHFIELFNYFTGSKIKYVSCLLEKQLIKNPRGKKFRDYAGHLVAENSKKQKLSINMSSTQSHGLNLQYTFQNGILFCDNLTGNYYVSVRKKKFEKYPSNLYSLPSKDSFMRLKKIDVTQSSSLHISNLLKKKGYVKIPEAVEAIKVLVAAVESNKNKSKLIKISNANFKVKHKWA